MCMEDIWIGRSTVDYTRSYRGAPEALDVAFSWGPEANQYRTALLLHGLFVFYTDDEGSFMKHDGGVEVWVDQPADASLINDEYSTLLTVLTPQYPRIMLDIRQVGMLVQRRFKLRPVQLLDLGTPVEPTFTLSYTEFVTPEKTVWNWSPNDATARSYR